MPITIPDTCLSLQHIFNVFSIPKSDTSRWAHEMQREEAGQPCEERCKAVCRAELRWVHSSPSYNISSSSLPHDTRKELNAHITSGKEAEVNCASFILNMWDSKTLNKGFIKDIREYQQTKGQENLCNHQGQVQHTPLLLLNLKVHIRSRIKCHPRRWQTLWSTVGSPTSLITPWKKVMLSIN